MSAVLSLTWARTHVKQGNGLVGTCQNQLSNVHGIDRCSGRVCVCGGAGGVGREKGLYMEDPRKSSEMVSPIKMLISDSVISNVCVSFLGETHTWSGASSSIVMSCRESELGTLHSRHSRPNAIETQGVPVPQGPWWRGERGCVSHCPPVAVATLTLFPFSPVIQFIKKENSALHLL